MVGLQELWWNWLEHSGFVSCFQSFSQEQGSVMSFVGNVRPSASNRHIFLFLQQEETLTRLWLWRLPVKGVWYTSHKCSSGRKKSKSTDNDGVCIKVRKLYSLPSLLVLNQSLRPFSWLSILFYRWRQDHLLFINKTFVGYFPVFGRLSLPKTLVRKYFQECFQDLRSYFKFFGKILFTVIIITGLGQFWKDHQCG